MKEIKYPLKKIMQSLQSPIDTDLTSLVRRQTDKIIIERPEQKQLSDSKLILLACAIFSFGVFTGVVLANEAHRHGSIFASDWKSALLIPVFLWLAGIALYAIRREK